MPIFAPPVLAWRRFRHPAVLALAVLAAWFLLESLGYRSGAYYRFLAEPESNTGAAVLRPLLAKREASRMPPTALVFGDSRVTEGFSPSSAKAAAPATNFVNVAVPGSTARTWFYLLRKMQRDGTPFDVVVIGLLYQPTGAGRWADWPLDPAFMAPLMDLRDAREFPASFEDADARRRAHQALWLPALLMQKDTQAMLASPSKRQRSLKGKEWWLQNIGNYAGRADVMPELVFDGQQQVRDWGQATVEQREWVQQHLATLASTPAPENDVFLAHWLGKVLSLVRRNGAKLVLFPLPRGPYAQVLPSGHDMTPALAALGREPDVVVLPGDFLADLEAPEFFFDVLHGNSRAQKILSQRLAGAVAEVVAERGQSEVAGP